MVFAVGIHRFNVSVTVETVLALVGVAGRLFQQPALMIAVNPLVHVNPVYSSKSMGAGCVRLKAP